MFILVNVCHTFSQLELRKFEMKTNVLQGCLIFKQWYEYKQHWFEKDRQTNEKDDNNKNTAFQQNKTHTKRNQTKTKAALSGCRVMAQNFVYNIVEEQNLLK